MKKVAKRWSRRLAKLPGGQPDEPESCPFRRLMISIVKCFSPTQFGRFSWIREQICRILDWVEDVTSE